MAQVFISRERYEFGNGAIGWRPGGPFDCLGPYAKVQNCPIAGTDKRLTCYATGYADTYFSIPACTRHKGKHVKGYFTYADGENDAIEFRVMDSHKHVFGLLTHTRAMRKELHAMIYIVREHDGHAILFASFDREWAMQWARDLSSETGYKHSAYGLSESSPRYSLACYTARANGWESRYPNASMKQQYLPTL